MRFTHHPPPLDHRSTDARSIDEADPRVMRIGDSRRARRVRSALAWAALVAAVGAVLVGFFVYVGATVGWALTVVILMVAYMAAMARWADGGPAA